MVEHPAPMFRPAAFRTLLAGSCLVVSACQTVGSQPPRAPVFDPPGNQSKCAVMRSQLRPLIIEWSSADRAALEVLAQRGTVLVRYTGCEMELLPRCSAPGSYSFHGTTRKTEQVSIRNEDELYASLPVGAARLEGKLKSSGQLDVSMNVVGQYTIDSEAHAGSELKGDCSKATHVVTGLTVGAFSFTSGAGDSKGGGAAVLGVGAGAQQVRYQENLSSDGEVASCERAKAGDTRPPDGCGALLRVEVEPISRAAGAAASGCPSGQVMVAGQCRAAELNMAALAASATPRLLLQVSGSANEMLGTADGLKVWIDGQAVMPADEKRAPNIMSPGEPGHLMYVAYDTTPGEHRVRVAADGYSGHEATIKVEPGEQRPVLGRLESNRFFERPPAAATSIALTGMYSTVSMSSVTAKAPDYQTKVPIDPGTMSGVGFGMTANSRYWGGGLEVHFLSGNGEFTVPACGTSCDWTPGTKQPASSSSVTFPLLFGPRLPLVWGTVSAGTGIQISGTSIGGDAAKDVLMSNSAIMGLHAPIWVAVEARPICLLSAGVRGMRGFGLIDNVSSFNMLTGYVSINWTLGCGKSDFGVQ